MNDLGRYLFRSASDMVCGQFCIALRPVMSGSPLSELQQRHLIAQVSDRDGLDAHLNSASRTVYAGFDPTADSLHIGNLVPLLALRRFQRYGHRPIVLVGGATGLIGDPSFKAGERALNARETVEGWIGRIRSQVSRFVDMSGNNAAVVVDNFDWTGNLDVISFLRDVGKHFSVNAMMQKESVRARLTQAESGISFTEFSYMLLQAMDYMELCKRYRCTVQLGGSDQWGNITSGMDLVRRSLGAECYALTVPLITKSDGTKFGKTESGSIWLDAAKTSPYTFYQFWLNTADSDVLRFLGVFTFLELSELMQLGESVVADPGKREAQRRLAREVTRLVHGEEGLRSAERISVALFGGRVRDLTNDDLEQLRQDGMPSSFIDERQPQLVAVLAASGLASSRGAARKLIQSESICVNGLVTTDCEAVLTCEEALSGRFHLIRRGKKAWHLVVHG
jgi:tyrosyl-tRNA synthetase